MHKRKLGYVSSGKCRKLWLRRNHFASNKKQKQTKNLKKILKQEKAPPISYQQLETKF